MTRNRPVGVRYPSRPLEMRETATSRFAAKQIRFLLAQFHHHRRATVLSRGNVRRDQIRDGAASAQSERNRHESRRERDRFHVAVFRKPAAGKMHGGDSRRSRMPTQSRLHGRALPPDEVAGMTTLLLLCAFSMAAGFVDAVVGGGGLIQLPAALASASRRALSHAPRHQ